MAVSAQAQEKKIKIGVIYDLTGPLAGGGSELQYTGAKIMLDQYAKTGVEGYKVDAIYADAQSKPDVAINEAVRLIEQEKVDMLLGFFSSAQCVPVAGRVEQLKKLMLITTRSDLPHRLQSRHRAAAAPGARTGAEVRRPGRPWRGLRRVREAEGRPRQRRELYLQHGSDLDLARESEIHGSEAAAGYQDGR